MVVWMRVKNERQVTVENWNGNYHVVVQVIGSNVRPQRSKALDRATAVRVAKELLYA